MSPARPLLASFSVAVPAHGGASSHGDTGPETGRGQLSASWWGLGLTTRSQPHTAFQAHRLSGSGPFLWAVTLLVSCSGCWASIVPFATLLEYLVVCTASCVQITVCSLGSLGQHPSLLDPVFDLAGAVAEAHVMLGLAVWLYASGVTLLSLGVREVLCPDVSSSEGWGRG